MKTETIILLGIGAYLLYQWYQEGVVHTGGGQVILGPPIRMQTCFDFVGKPYDWPVNAGPCPTS